MVWKPHLLNATVQQIGRRRQRPGALEPAVRGNCTVSELQ